MAILQSHKTTKMIKGLEKENWRIVKKISIVSTNQHGEEIVIGAIIYDRKITNDYKLNHDPEPNKIKRLLAYPRQDLFSVDEIDDLIFNAIKSKFPKSLVKNYNVIFDSDVKNFNILLKKTSEKATIVIEPDFSNVDNNNLAKQTFPVFQKEINIYQEFTPESIKSHYFRTTYNFEVQEGLIKELYKIEFK